MTLTPATKIGNYETTATPAGVTAIIDARMTPDGEAYAYSYDRELSDLFQVEGVR